MSRADIRTALAQGFVTGAFFDEQDIAWENVTFAPRPGNHPWAKFTYVEAGAVPASLGEHGEDQIDGFVQIDLNYPLGSGDDDVMQMYSSISTLFKTGARFTSNGQVVVIKSCSRNQGINLSGFYRVAVTIYFYAQIQR